MGTDLPQSGAGRQTSGRREPTRDLPRPLVEEKQSDATPVFTRFPALVDGSFEVPGWLGILGASHATGDGQEMACQGLSAVLALEIPPTFRAATDPKGTSGPIAHEKPSALDSHDQIVSIPVLGGLHHKYLRIAA